jgi:predicted HD phosphohydrolase
MLINAAGVNSWRISALRLRRYDDRAKVAGSVTPALEHYLGIARRLLRDRSL